MVAPRLVLALAVLALACGPDEPALTSAGPDPTPEPDLPPEPACGDGQSNDDAPCLTVDEVHPLDDHYHHLVVGDFDGDGARELLGASTPFLLYHAGELRLLALAPDGVYRGTPRLVHDGHFATLFVDDADADGRDDLLAITGETDGSGDTGSLVTVVRWLRSAGADGFVPTSSNQNSIPRSPGFAGDIDGDGRRELVVLTPVNIPDSKYYDRAFVFHDFAPNPDGYLVDHQSIETPLDLRVVLADLDADGRADMLGVDAQGRVSTWAGTPDAHLEPRLVAAPDPAGVGSYDLFAGDLDADGRAELLRVRPHTKDHTTSIELVAQTPGGAFDSLGELWVDALPTSDLEYRAQVHLLDLDSSGYPALVLADVDQPRLVVLPRVGLLHAEQELEIELAYPSHALFAEDLEGDGRVELLVVGRDDQANDYLQVVRVAP